MRFELGGLILQSAGNRKGGGIPQQQAAGLSHQHPYSAPMFPGNLFSANGPLRLGENDFRKSAHNSQTDKAGVRRRPARRSAACRDPATHRIVATKRAPFRRKIVICRVVLGFRASIALHERLFNWLLLAWGGRRTRQEVPTTTCLDFSLYRTC